MGQDEDGEAFPIPILYEILQGSGRRFSTGNSWGSDSPWGIFFHLFFLFFNKYFFLNNFYLIA